MSLHIAECFTRTVDILIKRSKTCYIVIQGHIIRTITVFRVSNEYGRNLLAGLAVRYLLSELYSVKTSIARTIDNIHHSQISQLITGIFLWIVHGIFSLEAFPET